MQELKELSHGPWLIPLPARKLWTAACRGNNGGKLPLPIPSISGLRAFQQIFHSGWEGFSQPQGISSIWWTHLTATTLHSFFLSRASLILTITTTNSSLCSIQVAKDYSLPSPYPAVVLREDQPRPEHLSKCHFLLLQPPLSLTWGRQPAWTQISSMLL